MSLNNEKDALIRLILSEAKEDIYKVLERIRRQPSPKDSFLSRNQREMAESLLIRNNHNMRTHEKILEYCVRSVATAPPGSEELAQAYAQRSKLLLHLRKYQECNEDIIRAFEITTSNALKVELHCRMVECSIAQNTGMARSILEEAEMYLAKVDPLEADIFRLVNKFKLTKAMLEERPDLHLDPQPVDSRTPALPTASAVRIKYSIKYGRHLVAARDIHPGELVLVEPVHAAIKNMKLELFRMCYHCLSMSWTLLPCDNCDKVLFCSDACKQEAMAKYHDVECPIVVALKVVKGFIHENVYLALKIVIMAIKEAGLIKNLMKMAMKVDDYKDKVRKGWTNGEFHSDAFSSFYSLSDMCIYSNQDYIVFVNAIVTTVMVNYTKLFESSSCIPTIDVMALDDNIMFIGALMLRMSKICFVNAKRFVEPNTSAFVEEIDMIRIVRNADAVRGFVMSAHSSLLNHSCNPNVYSVCTDDRKIVYYCALPIPKGSQIYDCYAVPFYSTLSILERKRRLYDIYQIKCDCEACEKRWVSASYRPDRIEHIIVQPKKFFDDNMLRPIMERFKTYVNGVGYQNLHWITRTSKLVIEDLKILLEGTTYPNPSIISMLYMLRVIMERIYGCIINHTPRWCIDHFKDKQSHLLKMKEKIGHKYVNMAKQNNNNDYNYHKYNKNDDHEVRMSKISEKRKDIKINSKRTVTKLMTILNKANICLQK